MNVLFLTAETEDAGGHFRKVFLEELGGLPSELQLLCAFDLKSPQLDEQAEVERPTLLVSAERGRVFLGPLCRAGRRPCFACLRHWLATAHFDRRVPGSPPGVEEARVASELARGANEAFESSGSVPEIEAVLTTVETTSGKRTRHPIFPLKDCPRCSAIARDVTYELRIHCSAVTGIVRSVKLTSGEAAGAFRASADWVSPLPADGARPLLGVQQAYGRGETQAEAMNGCLGEALERYSLIYRGDEALLRASTGKLAERGVGTIDPRSITLYSERQYAEREEWNRTRHERYFVGERFDPGMSIDWITAQNVQTGEPILAPAACSLMWYEFPAGAAQYAPADTVGCGSGRTYSDALLHALYEWIERDAMAMWWYNRARRPAVRLESFEDERLMRAQESMRRIGRELFLLDVTSDVGVPAYVSVAPQMDGSEPIFAGAAHRSPRVAAWKAASEVGQLWYVPVQERAIDSEIRDWVKHATLQTQAYMAPDCETNAPVEPNACSKAEELAEVVKRLGGAGLTAYAVDLSRTDVVLQTVRAIVPGMRHIWHRLGPGRLYSVPVELGWRDAALAEEDLNPICCMI